jgi:hypothetical protein
MRERGEREREKEREIGHRIMDFCEIYGIWRETVHGIRKNISQLKKPFYVKKQYFFIMSHMCVN